WCRTATVLMRHHAQLAAKVARVAQQPSALFQRFHDERDVPLFEVAHAAMDKLRTAAGCPFAEVALLQQQDVVAAGCGVDRRAHAGRSAADDDDVPALRMGIDAAIHFGAGHRPPAAARNLSSSFRYSGSAPLSTELSS